MKDFKKFGGAYISDLGEYVKDYIKASLLTSPNGIRIYVGCDSEHSKNNTRYATVVMVYHVGAGAHYIFKLESVPRVKDMYMKLWGEVERALACAEYLEETIKGLYTPSPIGEEKISSLDRLIDVDLDLNPNPKWKSHIAYDSGVGYIKAAGFRVRSKPMAWASTCAADLVVRKKKKKRKKF